HLRGKQFLLRSSVERDRDQIHESPHRQISQNSQMKEQGSSIDKSESMERSRAQAALHQEPCSSHRSVRRRRGKREAKPIALLSCRAKSRHLWFLQKHREIPRLHSE